MTGSAATALPAGVMVLGIAIGVILSVVCYLITNFAPGGMISPGWIAVTVFEDYTRLLLVAGVTVVSYLLVLLARRVVILYGKRLFGASVIIGVALQMTVLLFFLTGYSSYLSATDTLGLIVPGLITYQLVRQPVLPTLLGLVVISVLTFGVLWAGIALGFSQMK